MVWCEENWVDFVFCLARNARYADEWCLAAARLA
jgi:hypothetical protein